MADNTSVRVALRVRPLVANEVSRGCKDVIEVIKENEQVLIKNTDKAYSFNNVFGANIDQENVYERSVKSLIGNLFKGYNVTILAYGQTGSGKTHTMGTAYSGEGEMGVIPRAVGDIFDFVKDNFSYQYTITVSFMELYQEVLYDLLSDKPREQSVLEIREDPLKGIHIPNLYEVEVNSVREVLEALEKGTAGRATSATAMNSQSSRSHAIFTVSISMNHKEKCSENKQSKLHLVDLAGSERAKKTQAAGNTFKEGININKGLLALGNVISCLGDEKAQHGFVPYRDSSLTRLLKDSLGGNSITLMIACISPADYNLDETVSTLRYADRAKKIKNRPIINQDPKAAEISALKKTIQLLKLQILGQGGPILPPAEVELLQKENTELKTRKKELNLQLSAALVNNTDLHEKIMILQNGNEVLNTKVGEMNAQCEVIFNNMAVVIETNNIDLLKENLANIEAIKKQFEEINDEKNRTDEEIHVHDQNKHMLKVTEGKDKDEFEDLEEQQEFHADRQFKLNVQLTEIEKELNLKENLAKQLINNQYFVDPLAMAENESKISQLEKEKEELLQMLKNVGHSGKLSEQRRKRVQELEQQLSELKKKVQEQNHMLKLKVRAEERIKVLNQEIIQMKQIKVKLVKTMREESDKFRQWKLAKERECIRLKREDIKKAHEINKMKVMHNKQQNVFKRRVEEAEAINKRLKNALALKKQAQEARKNGKAEKLEPWLNQDFNLYVNLVEAEATLKVLLEDRATLQSQFDDMKKTANDDNAECKSIDEDLELRSVQIQDLQQKLLDSDEETRLKVRFEKFQTMGEAKYGIKFLYAKVAEVVKEKVNTQMKLSELQEMHKETCERLKEAKKTISEDMSVQQEYEERIAALLSQNADQDLRLEKLKTKCEKLEQKLECLREISAKAPKTPLSVRETIAEYKKENFKSQTSESTSPISAKAPITPLSVRETIDEYKKENLKSQTSEMNSVPIISSPIDPVYQERLDESYVEYDNIENDPDWRRTPLGKRILEEKQKVTRTTLNFGDVKPVKRSSEGGCTCKTNCKRCGCRKLGKSCSTTCKCNANSCENREPTELKKSAEKHDGDFKKPSVDDEVPHKKKKTRKFFDL